MRSGKVTLRDEDGNELVQPYAHGPVTAVFDRPGWGRHRRYLAVGKVPANHPPFTLDGTINDPMSATYTPTNDDTSFFLMVTATYMDAKNNPNDDPVDTTARTAAVRQRRMRCWRWRT